MSKLLLILFFILNFCNLENLDNVRIFEISDKINNGNEFEVRKGEAFALKFYSNPSTGYSWYFLNKDEISDSLLFIKSNYVSIPNPKPIAGRGGYMYYYFKALEVTNETQVLKFSYIKGGKNQNLLPNHLVKINVY